MKSRPAETAGVAAAVALLICRLLGVDDPDTVVALGIVVGFVPAAITWFVTTVRARAEEGQAIVEWCFALAFLAIAVWILSKVL